MRKFTLLVSFILTAFVLKAQVNVTFNVDMANETVGDTVSIAGSFQVAAGGAADWTPGDLVLLDGDGDDVYSVTVMLPAGTYQYKYLNGPAWGTDEGVPGACAVDGNREVVVGTTEIDIDPVCFGACAACPTTVDTVFVTFQVDMTNEDAADTVSVAGSFQAAAGFPSDWTPGATELSDDDGDNIYTLTVELPEGTYQYKFLNGAAWGTDESIPSACAVSNNREIVVVGPDDIVLPVVCFGTCTETCPVILPPVDVTFNVDMNDEIVAASGLFVAGNFQSPQWQKNVLEMEDLDGDGVYTFTTSIVPGFEYQFKYFNGSNGDPASDEFAETADFIAGGCGVSNGLGGSNRLLDLSGVTTEPYVDEAYIYNTCDVRMGTGIENLFGGTSIEVYPNPFSQSTTILFNNTENTPFQVILTSITGQTVRSIEQMGGNSVVITKENLSSGVYFVTIRDEAGNSSTQKLVIQ